MFKRVAEILLRELGKDDFTKFCEELDQDDGGFEEAITALAKTVCPDLFDSWKA